ncbi:TonB-dependent receptor [Sphingomonas sp. HT-1]|uniref:TonB-dependent receptor n=1 Tax=unclassified Sphingomonas TaxID=196159 RepID=UPI0002F5C3C5|nr:MULTISPECIES: TonB-dependent siderophore receptor [unclassified Sphingomonas]KTF69553.1 TonB-dependent receptor [Sphingomonas sp. WG]
MTDRSAPLSRVSTFAALACVGFIVSAPSHAEDKRAADVADHGPAASADPDGKSDETQDRDTIIVKGQPYSPHQESPKATRPVRDTPQTITILTNEVIEQQNLLTLRDMLSTVPGITFGAGEGGGGYGDSINLRGYSANSDITIDGIRDSAQYTRTDPFNLEQLEVVNGPNSVQNGVGSVGGSINLVTKKPQANTRVQASAGIGTDNYYRGTVDANLRVNELIAFRLNAMKHENDVPARDVEQMKRWGVAPSVTIGIESPTRLTLQYVHQEDDNTPQYGVPYYQVAGGGLPGVSRSSYFGFRNVDTQQTNVDQATATFQHDFNDRVTLRNITRWQDVTQYAVVNPPQGTWCLANGRTPTGGACTATVGTATLTVPAGYYLPSGPRGNTRDTRNQLAYDQVDLMARFNTGFIEHSVTLGAAAMWEKFELSTGNVLRAANGTNPFSYYPLMSIENPGAVVTGPAATSGVARVYGSNVYTGPINFIESARQTGELTNYAVYLFDTMKLGEHIEINGGVRWESNDGSYRADTVSTTTATLGQVTTGRTFFNKDKLFSYRAGLVYKPITAVSLYVAFGNSKTPSKTSVNGSCTVETCNVEPETARNYEVGGKAEVFGGRLLLTAALFRNERTNFRVATGDPLVPEQQLDGKSRVNGVALGAVGQITKAWSITANYTYLDGKVLRSIARNSPAGTIDPARNAVLQNTPSHSGSLFTTYRLPFGLTLGYGATYQGKAAFNLPTAAAPQVIYSPDFWVHNAFLSYEVTRNLSAQVNVKNVADSLYYTRIRNNGWATPGDGRSALLTLNYRF